MTFHIRHILHIIASATLLLAFDTPAAWAQQPVGGDSIAVYYPDDSLFIAAPLIIPEEEIAAADTMISDKAIDRMQPKEKRKGRDWSTWKPSPKRALWLAAVLPGGGQIYNRKFWKLPIFYGGFVGCIYALSWNNQMYHDYSQAYIDIMDNDPSTQSYNSFLHLGTTITEANKKQYQEVFRKRKDRFRRCLSSTSPTISACTFSLPSSATRPKASHSSLPAWGSASASHSDQTYLLRL